MCMWLSHCINPVQYRVWERVRVTGEVPRAIDSSQHKREESRYVAICVWAGGSIRRQGLCQLLAVTLVKLFSFYPHLKSRVNGDRLMGHVCKTVFLFLS